MSEPIAERPSAAAALALDLELDLDRFWELRALDAGRTASLEPFARTAAAALGARAACCAFLTRQDDSLARRYDLHLQDHAIGVDLPPPSEVEEEPPFEIDLFALQAPAVHPSALGGAADPSEIVLVVGAMLRDGNGWPLGALCLFFDAPKTLEAGDARILTDLAAAASDRLEAQRVMLRALRSEARLMAAVEAAPDAFVFYDSDDRLVFCNRRYREIYAESATAMCPGARFEEILRAGLANGQYPEAEGREEAWLAERLASHGAPRGAIVQPIPGDRWLRIEERRTGDGGVVGFRVDVTELKRHQRALEQAKAELQDRRDNLERAVRQRTAMIEAQARELSLALEQERRLNNLQRSFVSMASHEFRTPLAIIDGTLQRLRRRADRLEPEDLLRYCDKIGGSIQRLVGLIESTLSAARLEAGTLAIAVKPCDLGGVLRDCCDRQEEISPSHAISLSLDNLPAEIEADPSALEQVFANLLSNAVKYSGESDRIDVRAWFEEGSLEEGWVCVSVRDHGLGMHAEDLEHVGTRYFRAKTSAGLVGTGIGLNLVKAILEAHGGALLVESTLGEGSTFTVRLPASARRGAPPARWSPRRRRKS